MAVLVEMDLPLAVLLLRRRLEDARYHNLRRRKRDDCNCVSTCGTETSY